LHKNILFSTPTTLSQPCHYLTSNGSPPLLILFLISEQGLTIYDFRSIVGLLRFDFSGGNPSKIKNR